MIPYESGGGTTTKRRPPPDPDPVVYAKKAAAQAAIRRRASTGGGPVRPYGNAPVGTDSFGNVAPVAPSNVSDVPMDDIYAAALKSLQDNLSAYQANYDVNTGRAKEYATLMQDQLGDQRTHDLTDLLGGFAGRGMVNSSSYIWNQGDLMNQYQRRFDDVFRTRTQTLDDLARQLADFKRANSDAEEQAKQEAIARRAALYGSL